MQIVQQGFHYSNYYTAVKVCTLRITQPLNWQERIYFLQFSFNNSLSAADIIFRIITCCENSEKKSNTLKRSSNYLRSATMVDCKGDFSDSTKKNPLRNGHHRSWTFDAVKNAPTITTNRLCIPMDKWLYAFFAEALDVQRHHSLGQWQEPPAGLQMTEGVRTRSDDDVATLKERPRQQALGELERAKLGSQGALARESRPFNKWHDTLIRCVGMFFGKTELVGQN